MKKTILLALMTLPIVGCGVKQDAPQTTAEPRSYGFPGENFNFRSRVRIPEYTEPAPLVTPSRRREQSYQPDYTAPLSYEPAPPLLDYTPERYEWKATELRARREQDARQAEYNAQIQRQEENRQAILGARRDLRMDLEAFGAPVDGF